MRRLSPSWKNAVVSLLILVGLPVASVFMGLCSFSETGNPTDSAPPVADIHVEAGALLVPASYIIENKGQVGDMDVRYYASNGPIQVGFAKSAVLIVLSESAARAVLPSGTSGEGGYRSVMVRISFEGAEDVAPQGRLQLPHRGNYFLGSSLAGWIVDVPNYREVVYGNLYDGIDLVYRADAGGVKYEFVVSPGADPGRIVMRYDGIESLDVGQAGMSIHTALGDLHDSPPEAYQGGDRVQCDFEPRSSLSYGFDCVGWKEYSSLVIDPLVYSTFLGGSDNESAYSVAVDSGGNAYVTGYTWSVDFPVTPGAFNRTLHGTQDIFVTKLNAAGTALVYSTFIGGNGVDTGSSIAVDSTGNAYLTGSTNSVDFPVTFGSFDTTPNGNWDAFVVKLDANGGALVYSTFLGGVDDDYGYSITVNSVGNAYVTGYTRSVDFPSTPGAYDISFNGGTDGFATKLKSDGTGLLYATFLGGSGLEDYCCSMAIDPTGYAYLTGTTTSSDFPVTPGAFDTTLSGVDAFVAKLNPSGNTLVYSTLLGGSGSEYSHSIAVDFSSNAYVTGETSSSDFPVTSGAFDQTYNGDTSDIFVTKLNNAGASLVYSTFLGGIGSDYGSSIAVILDGSAYVTGYTKSSNFPVTPSAFDSTLNGTYDAFVTEINMTGYSLVNSTYLGGSDVDWGNSLALDSSDSIYLTGFTMSGDFPVTLGAFDMTLNNTDVFVTKLDLITHNHMPTAEAGPDQTVAPNWKVELNGSMSSDPDGDPLTFSWTQASGPPVVLNNASQAVSWFIPHELGSYTFFLRVLDGRGGMDIDYTQVNVTNLPPRAEAGQNQTSLKNAPVTLDGTLSSDPEGDTLTYQWVQVLGPAVTLNGASTPVATFTPGTSGDYSFNLTVGDPYGGRSSDAVTVTVTNRNPAANAGPDQTISESLRVVLNGSGSADPDGDVLSFFWVQTAGPSVEIDNATKAVASFLPEIPGLYVFELAVNDGDGETGRDTANVTVSIPPEVTINLPNGARVTGVAELTGTASNGSMVWLSIDDGAPVSVPVTEGRWTYRLDTGALPDGSHALLVRAERDGLSSQILTVTFVVANPIGGQATGLLIAFVAIGLASSVAGASVLLSEPLRVSLIGLLAIWGARLRGKNVLDNEKRGMIRGYLLANPGVNFSSMREDLGIGNGTLAYHLNVLEKEGIVRSWADGRLKRFALSAHRLAITQPRLTDVELILLQILRDKPGFTQEELARELGISQPAVSYHIKKLAEIGFIGVSRKGIRKHYDATLEGSPAQGHDQDLANS